MTAAIPFAVSIQNMIESKLINKTIRLMKKNIFLTTLCLSIATGATFAQSFGSGRGMESDPLRISSRAHLEELATSVNGSATHEGYHFKLTANLTGVTTIIGNAEAFFFSGTFDDDGHTIELDINTTGFYAGVFGYLRGATVKNTNVSGRIVLASRSYSRAGGICGTANNSTISNCYNTGSISASAAADGICGFEGNISNCFATNATITATNSNQTGRINGYNASISNCHALTSMKINGLERRSMNAGSKDGADGEEADFKNESWLTSSLEWDFKTVWTMGRNGWPVLKGLDEPTRNLSPEMPLPEIVLYLNPATHDVYIRSDHPVSKVEIYNSAGLCV
jgi:hypothetical protein